jgi:protein MAK11
MPKHKASSKGFDGERPAKRARIDPSDGKKPKKVRIASPKPESSPQPKAANANSTKKGTAGNALPSTFNVVAGSYEKLLYGLEGRIIVQDGSLKFSLKPVFIFPAHVSCIKAVAASPGGKWLVTGSADEIIKVWDLRRRKEVGGLMHHEGRYSCPCFLFCFLTRSLGSITHLSFPWRSYLLSASEDGKLCLFRARDWTVLRTLKGHKGRVNSVAVHPLRTVALSVGKDRFIRMWDLNKGKGRTSIKIGKGKPL